MSSNEQNVATQQAPGSRGLQLAKVAWPIPAATAIGILIASVPGYLSTPSLGVFDSHLILEPGTTAYLLARATLIASFLSAVGAISLSVFLFVKKRSDSMGLFLAYFLLGHGILFAGPIEMLQRYWEAAPFVNSFLLLPLFSGPGTLALVALFPDGRFVPPWSRWLIPLSFLAVPASLLTGGAVLPVDVRFAPASSPLLVIALVVLSVAIVATAVYAQVYRYRFVSTSGQRLQTKWVLYGLGLWMALGILGSVGWTIALQLPANTPVPAWLPLASLIWAISSLILPATLTISITRFRLFEIDLIINRTVVYGALTVGVIAIYIMVVAALGVLFQTQDNLLVALLATAVVAVVFQPLREWLQRGVNRLIFGERDDPIRALSRLGSRLETALAPDALLPALVETIAQTLKLPYVAILMPAGEDGRVAATHGKPFPDPVRFPLTYQGEDVGQLMAAPRNIGSTFSRSELRLLRNIARQAGAAIRAVQLTDDLRRSRQQIVTAREEERRRLRRDLHDGLGPAMAGHMLKLDAALDLIAEASEHGEDAKLIEATQLLVTLKEQTRESIKSIRRIVYGLRPPALDDLGLISAIKAYVSQQTGGIETLQVTIDAPHDDLLPLPAAVEVAVYRIVLEALTNVIHHARAQNCQIRFSTSSNPHAQIHLEIVDDGVGLPANLKLGVGLTSMHERATELGGHLSIESRHPTGTWVRADIPFESEAA